MQAEEKYFTVDEIADRLKVHRTTARRLFLDEEGVVRLHTRAARGRHPNVTLRVPESVLARVLQRMTVRDGRA